MNNSMADDLLNLSQVSSAQTPSNSGTEIFEKFITKFQIISHEIESLQRNYPQIITGKIVEKLVQLKRDSGTLTREIKKVDTRSHSKILDLENKCDILNNQVIKLKEEIENLVNINSDLHSKLADSTGNKSFLDITPKASTDKVNYSQFQASEDKLINLRSEIKDLKSNLESEKKDKKNFFAQIEWLRNSLEESISKYNELLKEKLLLEDSLADHLKDETDDLNLTEQLKRHKEKEVDSIKYRNNMPVK